MSKRKKEKAIVLSELEKVLLTLLYSHTLYGLEFVSAIKEASGGDRELGFGSLYPTLARMEKKGLVIWSWGDEQSGPRRKYYDITPYGKSVLEKDWRFHKNLKQYQIKPEKTSSQPEETVESATLTKVES